MTRLTQAFVDTVTAPGEYPDGDTGLVLVVLRGARCIRQYQVRSGLDVSRRAERVGAASMYTLEKARKRGAALLASLRGADPAVIERNGAEKTGAVESFFDSWTRGRCSAT